MNLTAQMKCLLEQGSIPIGLGMGQTWKSEHSSSTIVYKSYTSMLLCVLSGSMFLYISKQCQLIQSEIDSGYKSPHHINLASQDIAMY